MLNSRMRTVNMLEDDTMLGDDFYSSTPRSGKWADKEEIFANKLIEQFQAGTLTDCAEGSTLRAYLALRLNCAPMRISKKFAGLCIGKLTYKKKSNFDSCIGSTTTTLNSSCPSPTTIANYPTDLDSHGDLHSSFSFDTFTDFDDFLPQTVPYVPTTIPTTTDAITTGIPSTSSLHKQQFNEVFPSYTNDVCGTEIHEFPPNAVPFTSNSAFVPFEYNMKSSATPTAPNATTTHGIANTSLKRHFEDVFPSSPTAVYGTKSTLQDEEDMYPEGKRLSPTCCACGRRFAAITPGSPSPTSPWAMSKSDCSTPVPAYLATATATYLYGDTPPPHSPAGPQQQLQQREEEDRSSSSPVATYYSGASQGWSTHTYIPAPIPVPAAVFMRRSEAEDWLEVLESLRVPTTDSLSTHSSSSSGTVTTTQC